MSIRAAATLIAFFVHLAPAQAQDDATNEAARRYVEEASVLYKLGDYSESVKYWRKAYALKPLPPILFNLAQASRMAGHFQASKKQYETYLRDMPNAPNRMEVERQISQLSTLIAEEEAKAAAAKAVTQAEPKKPEPPPQKTQDPPPPQTLSEDVFEPVEPDPSPSLRRALPWVVSAVAVGLAAGSLGAHALARREWSEASSRERPRAQVDGLIAAGDFRQNVAYGLAGGALLGGVGAGVLFFVF